MDQRANTTADIAEVLRLQGEYADKISQVRAERQQKEDEYIAKRWAEIEDLANAAEAKEKVTDSVKWLEHQIRSLTMKLNMKHNQNAADQQRLKNARTIQEIRLRKIQYAQRKASQFKTAQDAIAAKAAPANEPGAQERLDKLQSQAAVLRAALANPDPTRSESDLATDRDLLATQEGEIAALEAAFDAKHQADNTSDHYIARSILPQKMKKALPTPFTLEGVSVRWADMRDALYAAGKWPEVIEHEELAWKKEMSGAALLSVEEYEVERYREVGSVLEVLQAQREGEGASVRV
jgi:hypothetical protein